MPRIRIQNDTGHDLERVVVYEPDAARRRIEVGSLSAGAVSVAHQLNLAYRYLEIEAVGSAGELTFRPYDFVGEQPLPAGSYLYRLGVHAGRATLTLEPDAQPDG